MKTCKETKKVIYYRGRNFNWIWSVKIRRVILCSILVFASLTTSILTASAKGRVDVGEIRVTMQILPPEVDLIVDDSKFEEEKIDDKIVSLNSKELLNASFSKGDELTVDRVLRNGILMTRVTKLPEEVLY